MAKDVVKFEEEGDGEVYGYKSERQSALNILKAHAGVRPGEASMIWHRIEYALDRAIQAVAPDGKAVAVGMAVGIRAFVTGPSADGDGED